MVLGCDGNVDGSVRRSQTEKVVVVERKGECGQGKAEVNSQGAKCAQLCLVRGGESGVEVEKV